MPPANDQKIRVLFLFGGRSSEHEISCVTATGILAALDTERFEPVCVGITKNGEFVHLQAAEVNFKLDAEKMPEIRPNGTSLVWPVSATDSEFRVRESSGEVTSLGSIDVVFPVLHGPFGEDGTLQGMLEMFGLPYVGSGVLASAACMDKHVAKTMLQAAGIDVAPWRSLSRSQYESGSFTVEQLTAGLQYPLFVKPARAGSSVGVSRVTAADQIPEALRVAFLEDKNVLVETGVSGREVEIAVLQGFIGHEPRTSTVLGEIVFQGKDYYDYEAKYLGSDGVRLELPAKVSATEFESIRSEAVKAYEVMQCQGPARIDFFLTHSGPILNEINTMPGFTPISMYPQLFSNSGLSYSDLVSDLIMLGLETER